MEQQKIILKESILVIILIGITLFLIFVFYFSLKNSTKTDTTPLAENNTIVHKQKNNKPGIPVRLTIPNIKVDATISQVGLTTDGAMDTPKTPTSTAWFKLGPRPGDIGSAVIDGHFGWGDGIVAVFDNLYKLKSGDKLYIEDDKGNTIIFVVQKLKTYDQNDYAKEVFYSNDNKSHLNLITCQGAWDKIEKSYSKRLIIFADKEIK